MNGIPEFDDPHLIRPGELRASRRLFQLCFNGLDLSKAEPEELASDEPGAGQAVSPPDSWYETCVISAGGAPVSQIIILYKQLQILDCRVRTGSIGGVCTHPDYRRHGLASRLLEYCTQRLLSRGARLMVISGGRGLYTRAGCVPMGKFAAFSVRPGRFGPTAAMPSQEICLRPASPPDAGLCSRLYQQEPVHFVRPESLFHDRFQPHATGFQAEEFVAEVDGQAVAYLLLSVPWQFVGQPGARIRQVAEYAGNRAALCGAILDAASRLDLADLQAPVPWQDAELIHLLPENGRNPAWSGLPGHTIRIIDLPGLMSDLQPYVRKRLPAAIRRGLRFEQAGRLLAGTDSDRYAIVRGKDRLDLDGAAMTRVVMGDPGHSGQAVDAPGALADIISAIFPLPSFFTGLDYH